MADDLKHIDDVAMEKATARFGTTADLTLMQKTVVDMGQSYAARHWLGEYYHTDPEVAVNCVELAQVRRTQMILALQKERDLERMAIEEDVTYEEAVFRAVQRQTHTSVNEEMERLNKVAADRTSRLICIADNMGLVPGTIDDAVAMTVEKELHRHGLVEKVEPWQDEGGYLD